MPSRVRSGRPHRRRRRLGALSPFLLSSFLRVDFRVSRRRRAASVFSVRRPSVTRTYFQFAMHVSYSSLPRSLLRSMALRAGGGRHAMQSPPPPLSPLLAAKKWISDSSVTQCFAQLCAPPPPPTTTTTTLTLGLAPCEEVWMDAAEVRCERRKERVVNRVIMASSLRLMSFRHLFSLHPVLPRFRSRFAKRAFATKIAIHTRTWTGGRVNRRRSPIRCIRPSVFALEMHFHITHEGRSSKGRREGRTG